MSPQKKKLENLDHWWSNLFFETFVSAYDTKCMHACELGYHGKCMFSNESKKFEKQWANSPVSWMLEFASVPKIQYR